MVRGLYHDGEVDGHVESNWGCSRRGGGGVERKYMGWVFRYKTLLCGSLISGCGSVL